MIIETAELTKPLLHDREINFGKHFFETNTRFILTSTGRRYSFDQTIRLHRHESSYWNIAMLTVVIHTLRWNVAYFCSFNVKNAMG